LLEERLKSAEAHKRFIESRSAIQSVQSNSLLKDIGQGVEDQRIETNGTTSGGPPKEVYIQNITIEVK
jgi:hypothetical protein